MKKRKLTTAMITLAAAMSIAAPANASHAVAAPIVGTGGGVVATGLGASGGCVASVLLVFDSITEHINPPGISGTFHSLGISTCAGDMARSNISSHALVNGVPVSIVGCGSDETCPSAIVSFGVNDTIRARSYQSWYTTNGAVITASTAAIGYCASVTLTTAACHADTTRFPPGI